MDTVNETRLKVKRQIWIWGNGCRKKENDFLGFTRKILVESTEMCYDTSVRKIHAQIWFIGRTLASQAGKAGSIPVICLFENSLKTWESQYLSAFPQFLLFPSRKHFFPVVTGELVWCKEPQNNEFRTKNFLNQDFLYGISLFCLCSENRDFLHSKISCFCIFSQKLAF